MSETPNIGLEKPAEGTQSWDAPLRSNYDILDAVIGAVSAVGNYDETTRPSLSGIIGSESGLGDKSLIEAIVANRTDIDTNISDIAALQSALTPAGLNSFDSNPTYKLSNAASLVEAINRLDGVNFEELNPSGAIVSRTGPDTISPAILTFHAVAGAGTPVGVGSLRWHKDRSSFGIQFFGQTAEGNEVVVTGDTTGIVIYGHNGVGSITIDIANYATLALQVDTLQQFALGSTMVDVADNVLTYDGDPACAVYDPVEDQWHFAFHDTAIHNFPVLTVTNGGGLSGGARIETNYGAGFSNGIKVYYVSIKGQDTTAEAFKGYFESLLAMWSMFETGTLQTTVFTNQQTSIQDAIEYIDTVGVSTASPWTIAVGKPAADVQLNFGDAVGEYLRWSDAAGTGNERFEFSKPLYVGGDITGSGALTVEDDITSNTGGVVAQTGVEAVTGNLVATAGGVSVLNNITSTAGNLDIQGVGALILTDGHPTGVDPDLYWDAVDDDYVVQSDGTPKIGTRGEYWRIGEFIQSEDVKLVAHYALSVGPPPAPPYPDLTQIPYLVYDRAQRRWMGQNGDGNPDFELGSSGIPDHNTLGNLAWSVAGHTMDTDLDMAGNSITAGSGVSSGLKLEANSALSYSTKLELDSGGNIASTLKAGSTFVVFDQTAGNMMQVGSNGTIFTTTKTTGSAYLFSAASVTTGDAVRINAGGLTSGNGLNIIGAASKNLLSVDATRVTTDNILAFTDSATEVWKDGSGNLTFKDAVTGTKTLAELLAGTSGVYLPLAGGIMTGDITMASSSFIGLGSSAGRIEFVNAGTDRLDIQNASLFTNGNIIYGGQTAGVLTLKASADVANPSIALLAGGTVIDSPPSAPIYLRDNGSVRAFIDSSGLTLQSATNKKANFDDQYLTVDRTYDLPDSSGTLALTSDLPKAGVVSLTAPDGGTKAVTFGTAMSDANYSIGFGAAAQGLFNYTNKTAAGFTIVGPSLYVGDIDWTATRYNS